MEIGVRLLGALEKFLGLLFWPVYLIIDLWFPKKQVPAVEDPILLTPAVLLAQKIRTRELTSERIVQAFVNQCRLANNILNAVVEDRFEDAVQEARRVDSLIRSCKDDSIFKNKPFLGVPFTVKESLGVEGLSHSVGCKPLAGTKAKRDGSSVARLRAAGGIPLAVTNTPELCLNWEANNLITGKTLNPYDTHRTSGGSSGGEAALLSSGASVIGLGSDIAGSIRIPSMFCGIYGHKTSPGCIDFEGHFPIIPDESVNQFLAVGPMTRYATDLRPLLQVLVSQPEKLQLNEPVNLSNVTVYYKLEAGFSLVALQVCSEVKMAVLDAAEALHCRHGCQMTELELPELADSVEISCSIFLALEGIPNLFEFSQDKNIRTNGNIHVEFIKSLFGNSEFSLCGIMFMHLHKFNCFIPRRKYKKYFEMNEKLKSKLTALLGDNSVFLYPTYPIPAFRHNEFLTKSAGVMYTMIFNALGFPATNVPIGLSKEGLPICIQVVAAPFQDRLCLAVAESLEAKFGGWKPPYSLNSSKIN